MASAASKTDHARATNLGCQKTVEKWLLFKYIDGEFKPLSKPFKTRQLAEKARLEYPERQRKTIGLAVIRTKS